MEEGGVCGLTARPGSLCKTAQLPAMDADEFACPICRELLYKPVANVCGHFHCFWCTHNAMSRYTESRCPLCRRAFGHFGRICTMLHSFLATAFPTEYAERARETHAMELEQDCHSPDVNLIVTDASAPIESMRCNEILETPSTSSANDQGPGAAAEEQHARSDSSQEAQNDSHRSLPSTPEEEEGSEQNGLEHDKGQQLPLTISASSFCCSACQELLLRPIVLNCGHVCCASCIPKPSPGTPASALPFRCQECHSLQPHCGRLEVCVQLQDLVDKLFPYLRKVQHRQDTGKAQSVAAAPYMDSVQTNGGCVQRLESEGSRDTTVTASHPAAIGHSCTVEGSTGGCSVKCQMFASRSTGVEQLGRHQSPEGREGTLDLPCRSQQVQAVTAEEASNDPRNAARPTDPADVEMLAIELARAERVALQERLRKATSDHERREAWQGLERARREKTIRYGIGCDMCGAFPIVGRWYCCVNCPRGIGFDLCESCNTEAEHRKDTSGNQAIPGRFNQKHTPDHKMVEAEALELASVDESLVLFPSEDHITAMLEANPELTEEQLRQLVQLGLELDFEEEDVIPGQAS